MKKKRPSPSSHVIQLAIWLTILLCPTLALSGTVTYDYDSRHRLLEAYYDNGLTVTCTYDALGNRLIKNSMVVNLPPYTPTYLTPADGAANVDAYAAPLVWMGGDPNTGDSVTYDLHIGTTIDPPLFQWDLSETDVSISNLTPDTLYYWKVVARDLANLTTEGPVWSFNVVTIDTDGDGISDGAEVNDFGTNPNLADTDGDGIDDGAELTYFGNEWNTDYDGDGKINLLDPDSDNDGYSDGIEIDQGFNPLDNASHPPLTTSAFETGQISVNHEWVRIDFAEPFANPVVVAGPLSSNGGDPAVIRLRNISSSGFELRLQEWNYLDGTHSLETVSYLAMEQGRHTLEDGTQIEAGTVNVNGDTSTSIQYTSTFPTEPVVVTTIATFNDTSAATSRLLSLSATGFTVSAQEEENSSHTHGEEGLSYIAWEPTNTTIGNMKVVVDRTSKSVKHKWYTIKFGEQLIDVPLFLATMSPQLGGNTASLRYTNGTNSSVQVKVSEEQSKDSETRHSRETVGYFLFSSVDLIDTDSDGITDNDEITIYGTDPSLIDTDGDGINDGDELNYWGTDWNADPDSDGLINILDIDSDNDGNNDSI